MDSARHGLFIPSQFLCRTGARENSRSAEETGTSVRVGSFPRVAVPVVHSGLLPDIVGRIFHVQLCSSTPLTRDLDLYILPN